MLLEQIFQDSLYTRLLKWLCYRDTWLFMSAVLPHRSRQCCYLPPTRGQASEKEKGDVSKSNVHGERVISRQMPI